MGQKALDLWRFGLSAGQIAEKLGVTRNAVIWKRSPLAPTLDQTSLTNSCGDSTAESQ
jgi:hypothetical protein